MNVTTTFNHMSAYSCGRFIQMHSAYESPKVTTPHLPPSSTQWSLSEWCLLSFLALSEHPIGPDLSSCVRSHQSLAEKHGAS